MKTKTRFTYLHGPPPNHEWYEKLNLLSILSPPPYIISILWFSVYACMVYSSYLFLGKTGLAPSTGLAAMLLQVFLMFKWFKTFFVQKNPTKALFITYGIFLAMMWNVYEYSIVDQTSAQFLYPEVALMLYLLPSSVSVALRNPQNPQEKGKK